MADLAVLPKGCHITVTYLDGTCCFDKVLSEAFPKEPFLEKLFPPPTGCGFSLLNTQNLSSMLKSCVMVALACMLGACADEVASPHAKLIGLVNVTVGERAAKQLEYELNLPSTEDLPAKSKVTLSIIYVFGLCTCGIDRCYMGQACLGTIKGLTAGGLFIWALVDWIVIVINMLSKSVYIDTIGFKASFTLKDAETAFWIAVVCFIIQAIAVPAGSYQAKPSGPAQGREKKNKVEIDPEEASSVQYEKLY